MTLKYLCENIQGCVLGYTQSDEISLVLIDYKKLNSSAWFDYGIQKCVSIAASMATLAFQKAFAQAVAEYEEAGAEKNNMETEGEFLKQCETYHKALEKGAMFDARIFNLPKEEVANNIFWRQLDATKNSIAMVAQANFSHKQLQNKSGRQMKEMLSEQKGICWDDYAVSYKLGSCCIHKEGTGVNDRSKWIIDQNIPVFKDEGRDYIEQLIYI